MGGYEVRFNVYAASQAEADEAAQAIKEFIAAHAHAGRAVTAKKVAAAVRNWEGNPLVRARIISYFKS